MKFLFKTKIAIFLLLILVSAFSLQGKFLPTVHADETPSEETSPQSSPTPEPSAEPESTPSPSPEPSVSPSPSPSPSSESETVNTQSDFCAQVITYACMDTDPSVCQEFATPCDVPADWTVTSAPSPSPTPDPSPSPTPSPTPSPSPSPSPTPSPTPTLVTLPTVSIGTTYTGSNSNVKVKFNSINGSAGSLTISETTISASEVSQVGALSSTVYDISSSMSNGNFTYDLTLPVPAGVTVSNLKVLYASSVENLGNATQVSQSITDNGDGTFTIHNLNHFTVFVVVNPNTQANCDSVTLGTTSGTTCLTTVQAAVNAAVDGDTITISNQGSPYNETVYVNKQLTITGSGNPTVTAFVLQKTPVTITGITTSVSIATPTGVALTSPVYSGNQTSVAITGTGAANAIVTYTIADFGSVNTVTGTGTVNSSGNINITGINVSSLNDGPITLTVSLTSGGYSSSSVNANAFKDTVAPAAPSISTFTAPINAGNQTTVSFSGTGEAGATLNWSISDGTNSITGTLVVPGSGSFTVSNQDVSSLNDGTATYTLTLQDTSTNQSTSTTQTAILDTVNPTVNAGLDVSKNTQFTTSATASDGGSGIASYAWTMVSGPGVITFISGSTLATNISASIDGTYVIRLTVTDVAGNSSYDELTLIWDTVVPSISSNNVIAGWYTSNPTITLTATDALSGLVTANVRYAWDSTANATTGTVFVNGNTISIPSEGVHTLNIYAEDSAGNSTTFSAVYRLDTVAPTANATGSSASWQNSVPTITLTATDATSTVATSTYAWDGGSSVSFVNGADITSTLSALADGTHSLVVTVTDVAGNTTTFTGTYKIDRVAPANPGSPTPSPTSPTNQTSQTWSWTVSTDTTSLLAYYLVTVDGGVTVNNGTTATYSTSLTQGTHSFAVQAVDNAGNTSSVITYSSYIVDTTAPVTSDNIDGNWHNSLVIITLSCSDNLSGCATTYYTTDGSNPTTSSSQGNSVTLTTDGIYTIKYFSVDSAGNQEAVKTAANQVMIDLTNPTAASDNVIAGWYTANLTIALTVSDPLTNLVASGLVASTVRYAWDSTANAITGTIFTSGTIINIPSDGTHTLNIYAQDSASNSYSYSAVYRLDTINPAVSATGSSSSWQQTLPSIVVTGTDTTPGSGVALIQYSWNGGALQSVTTGTDLSTLPTFPGDGNQALSLIITDTAGRTGTFTGTYKIDRVDPSIGITGSSSSWQTSVPSVVVTGTDATSGVASIQYSWNGGPYTATTSGSDLAATLTALGDGTHTLNIVIVDNAGRSSSVSGTYKIDTANPTVLATSSNTSWVNTLPSIVVSASDSTSGVASITYSWNSGAAVAVTAGTDLSTLPTFPGDGNNTLTLVVVDNAGRSGSFTGTYKLDRVNPASPTGLSTTSPTSSTTQIWNWTAATDATSGIVDYQYSIDGGVFVSAGNVVTLTTGLTQGTHTLTIQAVDAAGNISTTTTANVLVDTTIPVISSVTLSNSTGNNLFVKNGDTVTLTATVTDNNQSLLTASMITASLSALGGGVAVNPTSYDNITGLATWSSLVVTGTTNGVVTITVSAVDAAANSATAATVTTTADNILPTLSLINLTSSNANITLAKAGDTITLTFTSSETIQTPVVTIAGQSALVSNIGNNWTATYLLTSTDTEGLINYQITFADLASNIGTPVSATSAITFDRTNPTASWTTPTALENVSGNVTLTASVTDTTGITSVTFMYQRNDGVDTFNPIATITTSPFTSVWDTNSLTLDNYTLRMIVTDNAGNLTTLDQIVGVATVISSGSVVSTSTTSSSVNIVWTTDDQTSSRVIYDTSSHPVLGSAPNYGYAQSTPVSDTSPKVTNHSVGLTGLSSSTTYYYRVVSAGSPESVSSEFSFTTSAQAAISSSSSVGSSTGPTGAPVCVDSKPSKAPVLLSARVSGKNEITLVWGKAGDPVTYYLLEYGTEHDHYQYGVANLGDVTSFIVKDLTPGQTYYFRVRGGNNCAPGEFSNELFAKADGSFIAQAVVETISAALGATSVLAKTQTTGSQVISLGGDFENQEFSIGSEATSSTLSASPALSLSPEASVAKKSNNRLLLAGTALVFILAGALSYAVAIRKGNKI